MKIKDNDILGFWIDYIEVVGESARIQDVMFKWVYKGSVKTDSDYITDDLFPWFELRKTTKVMNYESKVIFRKNWFDCFAYHRWQDNWAVTTKDFLSVYWVAFKLFDTLDEIVAFVNENMIVEKLRRFDIAIDVKIDVTTLHKNFNKLEQKWSIFFDEKWLLQTFYVWEKKKSQNAYKLLRCYNKIDDIQRTYRQALYPEYFKEEFVSRIELEFRSELCQKIKLNALLDEKHVFDIFLSYIKQYTNIFNGYKYNLEKLNVQKKSISIDELRSSEYLKSRYMNTYLWYCRKLLEIWSCGVDIAIRHDLISEDTKKDIVLSIKDWVFRQDIYEMGLTVRNSKYLFADDDDDITYLSDEKEDE